MSVSTSNPSPLSTGELITGSDPYSEKNIVMPKEKFNLGNLIISEMAAQGNTTTLKLVDLKLDSIPAEDLHLLRNIEKLSLRRNRLISLPSSFNELVNLRYLDLHGNMFQKIPSVLMHCPNLEILDLSSNEIDLFPTDISPYWSENLKVLSLKNNNIVSVRDLLPITKLRNLSVLKIDGNLIPKEEIESVKKFYPPTPNFPEEEYWAIALKLYLENNPPVSAHISKSSKRSGVINPSYFDHIQLPNHSNQTTNNVGNNNTVNMGVQRSVSQSDPRKVINNQSGHMKSKSTENDTFGEIVGPSNTDLYNHSKYNDYFKRLSVLPEESLLSNEQHKPKVTHEELVLACRKLLFCFTECQQNVRKIASFCQDKAVAVNVVSLLYSVRSHIDSLVEVLQQTENEGMNHDQAFLKLCITIINIFKQIMSLLLKNFNTFFEGNELSFIRMFYMTLLCSYNEMYNAWCFISPPEDVPIKKKPSILSKNTSKLHQSNTNIADLSRHSSRTRSNSFKTKISPIGVQNVTTSAPNSTEAIPNNPKVSGRTNKPSSITIPSAASNFAGMDNIGALSPVITPSIAPSVVNQPSTNRQNSNPSSNKNLTIPIPANNNNNNNSVIDSIQKQHSPHIHNSNHSSSSSVPHVNSESENAVPNNETDVDLQLYETLLSVIQMVRVVYDQLTSEVSKTATATSKGQQEMTKEVTVKIKYLTETCRQVLDLAKSLNSRLAFLRTKNDNSDMLLTTSEKLKTWEMINAFLKSIISILANSKVLMSDLAGLNDVRPSLASLAKITKDVTVILDLSSYKAVSAQTQSSQTTPSQSQSQVQSQNPQLIQSQSQTHIPLQQQPQGQPMQQPQTQISPPVQNQIQIPLINQSMSQSQIHMGQTAQNQIQMPIQTPTQSQHQIPLQPQSQNTHHAQSYAPSHSNPHLIHTSSNLSIHSNPSPAHLNKQGQTINLSSISTPSISGGHPNLSQQQQIQLQQQHQQQQQQLHLQQQQLAASQQKPHHQKMTLGSQPPT